MLIDDYQIQMVADRMSEEDFFAFCQANRDFRIERDEEGNIIIMTPTGSETGTYNVKISALLFNWNEEQSGGYVFDSSTGFRLVNGAVRSPDASWVSKDKWESLSLEDRRKFAPICPDFVIELRSETDSLDKLKEKMLEYIANGCLLGWLIDRPHQSVFIYRANGTISLIESFDQSLAGEAVLPGFVFPLSVLK